MRSASIADWLLRRVASKEQAASIVGDLVEISPRKGIIWFWLAVAGVVAARIWRPALGLVLATYSGFWIGLNLWRELFIWHARHRPPEFWVPVFQVVLGVGVYLCWATVYSAIRFGVRDRFVRSFLAVAAVCVGLIYGWWQPFVLGCCIAGFAGVVGISIANRESRRTALSLPVVVVIAIFTEYVSRFAFMIYRYLSSPEFPRWVEPRYHGEPHSLVWFVFHMHRAIETLAIAATCEIMRRWSMSNSQKDSALEDGERLPGIS